MTTHVFEWDLQLNEKCYALKYELDMQLSDLARQDFKPLYLALAWIIYTKFLVFFFFLITPPPLFLFATYYLNVQHNTWCNGMKYKQNIYGKHNVL